EGIRLVDRVHEVVRRHAELRRGRGFLDDFRVFALRERRILRIEMPDIAGRAAGVWSADKGHLAEVALVVVAYPYSSILRHPAAEGIDVVGHGLGLRLQLTAVHAVQDQVERADDKQQREHEYKGELGGNRAVEEHGFLPCKACGGD